MTLNLKRPMKPLTQEKIQVTTQEDVKHLLNIMNNTNATVEEVQEHFEITKEDKAIIEHLENTKKLEMKDVCDDVMIINDLENFHKTRKFLSIELANRNNYTGMIVEGRDKVKLQDFLSDVDLDDLQELKTIKINDIIGGYPNDSISLQFGCYGFKERDTYLPYLTLECFNEDDNQYCLHEFQGYEDLQNIINYILAI